MTTAPARRAILLLVALFAALLSLAPAARADGSDQPVKVKIPWTGTIAITGPDGDTLRNNAPLHRGDAVHVDITKMSPDEQVAVVLHSSDRSLGLVHAGVDDGSVSFDFTVPSDLALGAHSVTFTGVTSDAAPKFAFVVVSAGGDNAGGGSNSPPGSGGSGSGTGSSSGGDHLASTGVDVLALLIAAGATIGLGALVTVASYRKPRRRA